MEDPVMLRRGGKKKPPADKDDKTKDKDEGDSTASTCGGTDADGVVVPDVDVDVDADAEMDLDDLMSTRSCITRSSSSGSRTGSLALRAMSDSFNNNSFNSSISGGNNSSQELVHQCQANHNSCDEACSTTTSPTSSPGDSSGRKLPRRTGSGYVRGVGANKSSISGGGTQRNSLRVIKPSSGRLAVSGAALREKRLSSQNQMAMPRPN
jgi:hypothetical protein